MRTKFIDCGSYHREKDLPRLKNNVIDTPLAMCLVWHTHTTRRYTAKPLGDKRYVVNTIMYIGMGVYECIQWFKQALSLSFHTHTHTHTHTRFHVNFWNGYNNYTLLAQHLTIKNLANKAELARKLYTHTHTHTHTQPMKANIHTYMYNYTHYET